MANQQTHLQNGKEALLERDQWIEMDKMLTLKFVVDKESWARMKGLKKQIQQIGLLKLFLVINFILFLNIYLLYKL